MQSISKFKVNANTNWGNFQMPSWIKFASAPSNLHWVWIPLKALLTQAYYCLTWFEHFGKFVQRLSLTPLSKHNSWCHWSSDHFIIPPLQRSFLHAQPRPQGLKDYTNVQIYKALPWSCIHTHIHSHDRTFALKCTQVQVQPHNSINFQSWE